RTLQKILDVCLETLLIKMLGYPFLSTIFGTLACGGGGGLNETFVKKIGEDPPFQPYFSAKPGLKYVKKIIWPDRECVLNMLKNGHSSCCNYLQILRTAAHERKPHKDAKHDIMGGFM
ncbi:hypothetical protein ACJX0J_031154, partial [Zea mays]